MAFNSLDAAYRALRKHKLTPTAALVLMGLAYHRNSETGACFPSIETIAKEIQKSERQVFRALNELKATGMVTLWSGGRKGDATISNRYYLHFPPARADEASPEITHACPDFTPSPDMGVTPTLTPTSSTGCHPRHPNKEFNKEVNKETVSIPSGYVVSPHGVENDVPNEVATSAVSEVPRTEAEAPAAGRIEREPVIENVVQLPTPRRTRKPSFQIPMADYEAAKQELAVQGKSTFSERQ